MTLPKDTAWFTAKRFGYGWGLPARWQGWVVLGVYVCALLAGLRLVRLHSPQFLIYAGIVTGLLVLICAWKGEAPAWRWGGTDSRRR